MLILIKKGFGAKENILYIVRIMVLKNTRFSVIYNVAKIIIVCKILCISLGWMIIFIPFC